jgi:hypothetical protein
MSSEKRIVAALLARWLLGAFDAPLCEDISIDLAERAV